MNVKEKVLIHKGMDKVRQGLYDEAIEIYDRVLVMNPENTHAWNNRGVALFSADRSEEALECYDRSIEIDPENLDALRNRGYVLRSMGRMKEALQAYEQVMGAGGDENDLESMATLLVGTGMFAEALDCLNQAMSINPTERIEKEIIALMSTIEQREQGKRQPGDQQS
jgi:tetratricopeptide (TPR) repeat protein